jgi:OOP family OmpA-OmpF porin
MKKLYLILAFLCLANLSFSQLRLAILGGPHTASVKEQNSIPSWETQIKPGYSSRPGLNLGVLVDIPLSSNSTRWFLQPGIIYMSKGRKYYKSNDSLTSSQTDTISASHNLAVNYIDIPFNLTYKLPLGKNAKFILSAGPYIGFFYSGKQTFETRIYSSNSFKDDEVKLETGNTEGKMKTFNAGFNARAGFELGNVMLTGFMSEGLTSFYTAPYEGTFKHQVRGVSLGLWLNRVKQLQTKTVKTVKAPKDTDKDGVPDNIDECPKLAGSANTNGCPDKDDDGVADKNDKCPDVAGILKFNGCPIPDTDGDGMNDEADACPAVKGVVEFNGCPVPDMDGDGLNDLEDKCPMEAGLKSNNGCPEPIKKEIQEKIHFAAKNIMFRASSDQLTLSSYDALDAVVNILKTNSKLKLAIEGHTDSTGSYALNAELSQKRAESVKEYLIEKGINSSRLSAKGYGSSKPLVSNETLESRKKNRRVELKLVQ